MPTTRPRHAITETPHVAAALAAARERWPADRNRPGKLLLHLIDEGHKAVEADRQDDQAERLRAIARISGAHTGLYPAGYLDELRAEWPE